ncbi:MAG: hypothetical protein QNJ73_00595 [Gammaproteobacteria bacterium]|nr:hypothetical protein [Gammaproteobacteria bacterium]
MRHVIVCGHHGCGGLIEDLGVSLSHERREPAPIK